MSDKIKLEMTEDQAKVVMVALDSYNRAKLYQFYLWFEAVFPELSVDYDDQKKLEEFFDSFIEQKRNFKDADTILSYCVYKTLRQYFSVKDNDGYFGFGVSFDGPLGVTPDDCPKIEGFKLYKDIKIPKKFLKLLDDEKYELFWKNVDNEVLPKYDVISWEKIQILKQEKLLRIWKPHKRDIY